MALKKRTHCFLLERRRVNGGEKYGEVCRCWRRKLRNFCSFFLYVSVMCWKKKIWVFKGDLRKISKDLE